MIALIPRIWKNRNEVLEYLKRLLGIDIDEEVLEEMVRSKYIEKKDLYYFINKRIPYEKDLLNLRDNLNVRDLLNSSPNVKPFLEVLKKRNAISIESGLLKINEDPFLQTLREIKASLENSEIIEYQEKMDLHMKLLLKLNLIEVKKISMYRIPETIQLRSITKRVRDFTNIGKKPFLRTSYYEMYSNRIRTILSSFGFSEVRGPLLSSENSFRNLDIPLHHPSRSKTDTLYMGDIHLRTHTTNVSAENLKHHYYKGVFTIGRVFRNEREDDTHASEFFQVDICKWGHLENFFSFLENFFSALGFEGVSLANDYFPFTEPSFEINTYWKGALIEIGGGGMFTQIVRERNEIPGIAWACGFGLDRIIMVLESLSTLRKLRE